MAVKKCCIENCNSCSTRQEDVGVTYHKLPKDITLRDIWITVTRHANSDPPSYVCSRHFCKSDFQMYKDSKYVLKSDAVPSIFSWTMTDIAENKTNSEENMEVDDIFGSNKNQEETLKRCSKDSDENLDAIKKFIEDQEKEISTLETEVKPIENVAEILESNQEKTTANIVDKTEGAAENEVNENTESVNTGNTENQQIETMAVASSVMDMILSESEAKIAERKETKAKENMSQAEKANCMALSVGSKVEAKDFGEYWHPAQITEVDYDEMEVLVHYEHTTKKLDEWISVSSPRLRPVGSGTPNPPSTPTPEEHGAENTPRLAPTATPVVKEEIKHEEKQKVTFAVGERCLARWRDNRRFVATISEDLGDGKYEIMFDDGVRWSCTTTRLCKLKEPSKRDSLSIDTTYQPAGSSTLSPVYGPGPSNVVTATPLPAYHTHLFDPTRDYLGSKSERREMKRKLNIKEIFNIGQKKKKIETPKITAEKVKSVKEKKPKVVRKRIKTEPVAVKTETEVKKEVPVAVASIIGTAKREVAVKEEVKEEVIEKVEEGDKEGVKEPIKEEAVEDIMEEEKDDVKEEIIVQEIDVDSKIDIDDNLDIANSETLSAPESQDMKHEDDPVLYEKTKLEKFEQPDDAEREEVIDRIKEVITKLEDGLNEVDVKPESVDSPKLEIKDEVQETPVMSEAKSTEEEKPKKNLTKVKKGKKLRLLQEKKVKKQVERVKNELEAMKKQMEEMRKQMLQKTEEIAKSKTHRQTTEMPDSFLLPGEWCCKWVNGQPVGTVSEMESEVKVDANNRPGLPRRSVQVEDPRLPEGWTKHMVRRSLGHSAGKWDVVLVSPDNRRFHTKTDMRLYLENVKDSTLKPYENALFDFGVHLKLARRMGWYTTTPDGIQTPASLPAGTLSSTSPLVKRKSLSLKKKPVKLKEKKRKILKIKKHDRSRYTHAVDDPGTSASETASVFPPDIEHPPLEEGYVYVGSLKVQVIDNLLRCPAEGCLKNFRNNTLLKMHIKHYHRELRKMLGATPKVLDLAYARARPTQMEMRRLKLEAQSKTIRVKLPKLAKRLTEPKPELKEPEQAVETPALEGENIPRSQDSPKLRHALVNKPVKRPRVLLPVRRPEQEMVPDLPQEDDDFEDGIPEPIEVPIEPLDFETAISTHTVTKPPDFKRRDKKRKSFASVAKRTASEDDEWFGMNSDVETRSSFPRSGSPDSKDQKLVSSESNEEQKDSNYMYTETGERIKIVHMKREEIINCHCGFREEDGLMVQCELCLCWQHALCHNIQRESEVPEKYTCSICLNPRRGRRSQRFLHDQDRLYEGLLPGAKPCESLRRSHELSGNLLKIEDALHALRVKYYVATKKDHPKLYLWAKDWETGELNMTQEKLNSDYSDLNIIISNIGKENLPMKPEEMSQMSLGIRTPPSEEPDMDRFSQKDNQLGSQSLLSGFLSSPGGASLDLPISTSELERLAKTVQAEQSLVVAPQPEAAIEDGACRQRLLRHITRCQAVLDARLDSIEAQVAELESQDPSFEDDETADYFPRTKQTIQMLLRDLDTMEELGVIT